MAISAGPTLARILAYNAGVGGSNPSPPTRKPSSGGLLLRGLGWTQIACSILQQDLARDQARCGEIMRASGASNFLHHRSVVCHQLGTTSGPFLPLTRDHPLATN